MTHKEKIIEKNFTTHNVEEPHKFDMMEIRKLAKDFAYFIEKKCPDSREKSLAITKLEEAMFWANASIARNN